MQTVFNSVTEVKHTLCRVHIKFEFVSLESCTGDITIFYPLFAIWRLQRGDKFYKGCSKAGQTDYPLGKIKKKKSDCY